jgi:16S rRNA (cytosine967-C5)-methyltransferase
VFAEETLARQLTSLKPLDRGLCQELVCGVIRWQRLLDWLIKRQTQGRQQKWGLQNLLRLGLYQLFWLDRVPDHAAVSETVTLARQFGFGPQAGFVNATLRNVARERTALQAEMEDLRTRDPALGHSHPQWLYDRWVTAWGRDSACQLMVWNNTPPPRYARVNTLRIEPGQLLEQWRGEDVDYDFFRSDWIEENLIFRLREHPWLASLESFRSGAFYVQDPSTLLAVHLLDPQPGERILDACAAPGGKTTYIAQRMANQGCLIAQDRMEDRLQLLDENCRRLGVTCVETSRSGCIVFPELNAPFDRILVDAPCSNTGVMARRVELRWRLTPAELDRLRALQLELLHQTAPLLRPGGTLVYSTCSLEPEENQQVLESFRQQHPDYDLIAQRQLLPFQDRVDGTFIARLQRRPS